MSPSARRDRDPATVPALRPLVDADLDDLLALQREGAVAGLGHIFDQASHPFPVDDVRARWARELLDDATACFAIVDDHGRLAGFAATRQDQLLHFGTAPETWGTGLAGRAHDAVLEELRSRGLRSAWLRVFAQNTRARRFYERRGWAPTGETTRSPFPPGPLLLTYGRPLTRPPL